VKLNCVIVLIAICVTSLSAPRGQCQMLPAADTFSGGITGKPQTQINEQAEKQTQADKPASASKRTKAEKRADLIKGKLRGLGIASRVTIMLNNGNERYGSIERIDEDTFQLAEVDLMQTFTISYDDVKKIREGYGRPNQFTGKRWNPIWAKLSLVAVIVMFVVVVPLSIPRT
jgi:hypothetical protein